MENKYALQYRLLSESISYYESFGYKFVEVPWLINEDFNLITKPESSSIIKTSNGLCLPASGEQCFLQQMFNGFLYDGSFQTITPCFREGDVSTLHREQFLKNELIQTHNVTYNSLINIVDLCREFFAKYLPSNKIRVVGFATGNVGNFDIEFFDNNNIIELGSYGIRRNKNVEWIFATGCAVPRLSNCILIQNS